MSEVFLFLNKSMSTSAPSFSKAFFVSHSLFVPGNAGITTFTFSTGLFDFNLLFSTFLFAISVFNSIFCLRLKYFI